MENGHKEDKDKIETQNICIDNTTIIRSSAMDIKIGD
jgi:hypothetical protein